MCLRAGSTVIGQKPLSRDWRREGIVFLALRTKKSQAFFGGPLAGVLDNEYATLAALCQWHTDERSDPLGGE